MLRSGFPLDHEASSADVPLHSLADLVGSDPSSDESGGVLEGLKSEELLGFKHGLQIGVELELTKVLLLPVRVEAADPNVKA